MTVQPTAFPVSGENFRDRTGALRGVTAVSVTNGVITVNYLEGAPEIYPPKEVGECV